MPRTLSAMPALGRLAGDFDLINVDGRRMNRKAAAGPKGLLVMFLCNHCPFVKHVREELARLGRDAQAMGIGVVAISSNDAEAYPDDGPEHMRQEATAAGYTFPYLYDESQEVAKAYGATCTPDFFLHDATGRLVYRGQLDDSRPNSGIPVTGADLRAALTRLASGQPVVGEQKPSMGCNIKWKPGNEPVSEGN